MTLSPSRTVAAIVVECNAFKLRATNSFPRRPSPDSTAVFFHHRLARLACECLLKFGQVHYQAVDAVPARRVWICDGVHAQVLWPVVLTRPLRISDKEALLGSEAVAVCQMHGPGLIFPCHPSENQSAKIGDVFPLRELAVDLYVVHDDVLCVLIHHALRAGLEALVVPCSPPILQVALSVELAALIVEAVSQLVTNGSTRVAIVGRVVHLGIVKRGLQYAGRKIDVVHARA